MTDGRKIISPPDYMHSSTVEKRDGEKNSGLKSVAAMFGLTLFFVLAMAGVLVSLRQRFVQESVAPNAPESQPAADVVRVADCSLTFSATDEYSCNTTCETDEQCQTANPDYVCSPTDDGNRCRLEENPESEICQPEEVTYECNSPCTTHAECQTADENYVCYEDTDGRFCRLSDNLVSDSCTPPVSPSPSPSPSPTPSPTPTPSPSVSPSPTPSPTPSSPAPGCNETCVTNADCSSSNHICFETKCRLAENPTNQYCALAQTPNTSQPPMPEELPKSGSDDVANWVKAGLGILGIGAILLLLL